MADVEEELTNAERIKRDTEILGKVMREKYEERLARDEAVSKQPENKLENKLSPAEESAHIETLQKFFENYGPKGFGDDGDVLSPSKEQHFGEWTPETSEYLKELITAGQVANDKPPTGEYDVVDFQLYVVDTAFSERMHNSGLMSSELKEHTDLMNQDLLKVEEALAELHNNGVLQEHYTPTEQSLSGADYDNSPKPLAP